MGLPVTIEQHGGAYTLTVHIPPRRNGEPNNGAMGRVASLVATVVPAAFDPEPAPKPDPHKHGSLDEALGCGVCNTPQPMIVPHSVAAAMQRDIPPPDDDEGEPIPGYRCANGACVGD